MSAESAKGVTTVAVVPSRIGEGTPYSRFVSGPAIVLYLAFAKLLLHVLTAARYGIFRDDYTRSDPETALAVTRGSGTQALA